MKTKGLEQTMNTNEKNLAISYEEYYNLVTLAHQIAKENEKEIKAKNSSAKLKFYDTELKKKYKLNDYIQDNAEINIILRSNILIPDTNQFFIDYNTNGKNIRILAELYDVSAPVIINKITEIGTYGPYLNRLYEEKNKQPETPSPNITPTVTVEQPIVKETPTTSDLSNKIIALIHSELDEKEQTYQKISSENKELVHLNTLLREQLTKQTEENQNLMKEIKALQEELKKANSQINYVKNFMNLAETTINSLEEESISII